jgi:hypothetical protein
VKHDRSHGILMVMLGIVLGVMGIMKATMLPTHGISNWALSFVGLAFCAAGLVLAIRGEKRDDRISQRREREFPRAKIHRR